MANSSEQLRGVSWTEVLGFSHIFKSFRMAYQPAKVFLAIAAVICIFLSGHVLDGVWGMFGQKVPQQDITRYVTNSRADYNNSIAAWNNEDKRIQQAAEIKVKYTREKHALTMFQSFAQIGGSKFSEVLNKKLNEYNKENEKDYSAPYVSREIDTATKDGKDSEKILSEAKREYKTALKKIAVLLEPSYEQARKEIKEDEILKQNPERQTQALDQLTQQKENALRAIVKLKVMFKKDQLDLEGRNIFESFLAYEVRCTKNALAAIRSGKIMAGMDTYEKMISQKAIAPMSVGSPNGPMLRKLEQRDDNKFGFAAWMLMFVQGIMWLVCEHTLFAIVFGAISLAVWAIFGGAIHRMAALHAAREEMISIPQALKFARDKFWSFFFAPLFPLGIILVLGLVLILFGLIGSIPWIGSILMGLLTAMALVIAMVMTFLLIGLFAGVGLMYPTIAVEGSDTFDALNRSVSFTFSHPWRAMLYGFVALLGGSIWYLFARTVAYLTLTCAHWFIKIGVVGGGAKLAQDADKLDLIWPAPTFSDLHPSCSWAAMSLNEVIAAAMVSVWVYLVIAAIAAVMITYFSSAATMIYYLLRRKVDAADLDEVYVEEGEDELFYEEDIIEQTAPPAEETPEEKTESDSNTEPENENPE